MKNLSNIATVVALLMVTGLFGQQGELVSIDPDTKRAYYTRNDDYKVELDGSFSGNIVAYFEDGTVEEVGALDRNQKDGKWIKYNSDGNVVASAKYKDGMKDGVWKIWDGNGNLRMTMYFDEGRRIGIWKFYDEEGKLMDEKNYE